MRAIHIDAKSKTVKTVQAETLTDMQKLVGGYIEIAQNLPGGDILFVDEEGLLKERQDVFFFNGHAYVGNGLIIGDEKPAKMTLDKAKSLTKF